MQTITPTFDHLARQGFQPGTPAHVTGETRAIDKQLCKRARCTACKTRGLAYRPYQLGKRYRILAACEQCGSAIEM